MVVIRSAGKREDWTNRSGELHDQGALRGLDLIQFNTFKFKIQSEC